MEVTLRGGVRHTGRMSTPPAAHEDAITRAVRAHLVDITSPVVAHGLRSGMIRRREGRVLSGAAAAIARATGVPQGLLRALFALTALLGFGVPMYLLITVLTPTERTVESALEDDRAGRTVPRSGLGVTDLLLHLLVGLTAVGAVLWMVLLVRELLLPALSVTAVAGILLMMVVIAAERARNARLVFLISETARRAGMVSAREVCEAVERQRRLAPRAWAGERDWSREDASARPDVDRPADPGADRSPEADVDRPAEADVDRPAELGADYPAATGGQPAPARRTLDGIGVDPAITGEPREEQHTQGAAQDEPPRAAQ